jgi:hypothetical protein
METASEPRVTLAERMEGGVIISFADGKCAVYSASLLYATLSQASHVDPDPEDFPESPRLSTLGNE